MKKTTRTSEGGDCSSSSSAAKPNNNSNKPPFVPAKDDTKPILHDPILRSDPKESEEAVLRLPSFRCMSK